MLFIREMQDDLCNIVDTDTDTSTWITSDTAKDRVASGKGAILGVSLKTNTVRAVSLEEVIKYQVAKTKLARGDNLKVDYNYLSLVGGTFKGDTLEVPYGVSTIGAGAFTNNNALRKVILPNTVSAIGREAFFFCDWLSEVIFPDNLIRISPFAFSNCESLRRVHFGKNITYIGKKAFYSCTKLREVSFEVSEVEIEVCGGAFNGCDALSSIFRPKDATEIDALFKTPADLVYQLYISGSNLYLYLHKHYLSTYRYRSAPDDKGVIISKKV